MAEYKGKLLKGLFRQAKDILMSDGTNIEDTITQVEEDLNQKQNFIEGVASNSATDIVNWLNNNQALIPLGSTIINFGGYAIGVCAKVNNAYGKLRLTSYYAAIDNKSSTLSGGTWSTIS